MIPRAKHYGNGSTYLDVHLKPKELGEMRNTVETLQSMVRVSQALGLKEVDGDVQNAVTSLTSLLERIDGGDNELTIGMVTGPRPQYQTVQPGSRCYVSLGQGR